MTLLYLPLQGADPLRAKLTVLPLLMAQRHQSLQQVQARARLDLMAQPP